MVEMIISVVALFFSGIALVFSGISVYRAYFVGPDIKLVFNNEDRNPVWDYSRNLVESNGIFVNKGNRTGYIIENPINQRAKIYENIETKDLSIFNIPSFIYTIEPSAPIRLSLEPQKIGTPLLLREGDSFPFKIYLYPQPASRDKDKIKEIDGWFKEHSGRTVEIKIYYTTTTKNGLELQHEKINLKI